MRKDETSEIQAKVVPYRWKASKLEDISDFITKGATPTTYGYDWVDEGILFLRSDCVSDSGFVLGSSMKISREAHEFMSRSKVQKGDILISITGNVGKVGIVPSYIDEANINQHIARIRINKSQIEPKYIYYYLSRKEMQQYYERIKTGLAYPQISLEQIRNTIVLFPTIKEQQKIAGILSTVDEHIEETESLIEKTKELKKGLMQRLLTKGIGHTKFKKTEVGEIPVEWEVVTIGDICELGRGRVISKKEIENNIGEYPVYSSQTYNNGCMGYICTYDFDGEYITWTTDGVNAGTTFYRNGKFNCTNVCGTLKLRRKEIDAKFLSLVLNNFTDRYVVKNGNPKLMNNIMQIIRVPISKDIKEQKKISKLFFSIDEQLEQYEFQKGNLKQLKNGLMQKLLTGKIRVKI